MTPEQITEIDKCLASWCQGDVALGGSVPFVHLADLGVPTTDNAEQLAAEQGPHGLGVVSAEVFGLVVVTQTCDIVRTCRDRPFVEVCPLVELSDDHVALVQQGRMLRFAALPALENPKLAADLDRVMTIEKGLLASITCHRKRGVGSESEAQILTEILGRKRTRAALPDAFVSAVASMRDRILDKHKRASREGDFLRAVREIRVRGVPDWTASVIEVEFLFVFDRGRNIPDDADHWIKRLVDLVPASSWIADAEGRAVGLDQLSAASYIESYRLDLDHLSQGT